MEYSSHSKWFFFTIPPPIIKTENLLFVFTITFAFLASGLLSWRFTAGGPAWKHGRNILGRVPIPGPGGLPIFGSIFSLTNGLAHRTLASLASSHSATKLMAFSLGSTPAVVASEPHTAREILTSPHFASRPVKQSAKLMMFNRAIGFAPDGSYWRLLRKIASSHLFAPKRILAYGHERQEECLALLIAIKNEQNLHGFVVIRKHLQAAALNNIMTIVFGKRYDLKQENNNLVAKEIQEMVREGFELLGDFNWCDHLPWLKYVYDPYHIKQRCLALVPRVKKIVKFIIAEHRYRKSFEGGVSKYSLDFVDVLLSLSGEEKLHEDDMVAILWEMIFRGTDTTALLTEWVMAELVKNQEVQAKLHKELFNVVGNKNITDEDVPKLAYLEAVVKETLRLDPPGPLLSWSRLSTSDVCLSNGMVIPTNTTAMVNMWAISRDPTIWDYPLTFRPERFLDDGNGLNIDVRGNDLRLAPFGAGRRVCPGKNLGLATVSLWVAKLVQNFEWVENMDRPVDLTEVLKLSSEMKSPLSAIAVPRKFINA